MPPGEQLSAQLQLVVGRHRLLDQQLLDGVDECGLFYRRHVQTSASHFGRYIRSNNPAVFCNLKVPKGVCVRQNVIANKRVTKLPVIPPSTCALDSCCASRVPSLLIPPQARHTAVGPPGRLLGRANGQVEGRCARPDSGAFASARIARGSTSATLSTSARAPTHSHLT